MITMFKAVCPVCEGEVVPIRNTHLYLCTRCHMEHDETDLKLVPVKQADDANPFKS